MNWFDPKIQDPGKEDQVVAVSVPSRQTLLEDLGARLSAGRGFSVATLNLDHVVKLRRVPEFRTAYQSHTHVTADGQPIVWLLRLARQPVELVAGADLVEPVIEMAAARDVPVAFVGSTPGSLARAGEKLTARHKGLSLAAQISPQMGFDPTGPEAERIIDELAGSGARLVFLALGAPKQEIFAARLAARLPDVGILSVGAGLDFISGAQTRAPRIIRMFAAEWLWRMLINPVRLGRRYLACIVIMPRLVVTALRHRSRRAHQISI